KGAQHESQWLRRGKKGQGQEAPYSRRHAGFVAARHHSSCRYPRSRWRHPASCDPFRDVPFLEKALCRWWLPGAGLSKGLGEDLATARFVALPRRWVVDRTFAWLNRCRRLAKDWENLNRNALAFLRLASIRLMLRKLCNPA